MVNQSITESFSFPVHSDFEQKLLAGSCSSMLDDILQEGARKMLATAIEAEVADWVEKRARLTDDDGHKQVVRNGYKPARSIVTGVGPLEVKQGRVLDRRSPDERETFTSKILPPYLRKAKSIDDLIPWLYLYGISTGDMSEALEKLVGPGAKGLSASAVTRLKADWETEYNIWSKRSLKGKQYVYVWADGIHFNLRMKDSPRERQCILVLLGATADGKKELIAVIDGVRESKLSWKELLLEVKHRGLEVDPKLAIGDGALGFWAAVREVWPAIDEQRCWVHKTANILNKMHKSVQPKAKEKLHDIWMAPTHKDAVAALELFAETYEAKYPKAVECLTKDHDVLLTFYDYPAEHWMHLRTTNPIESVFATVRLRHKKTKGSGSRIACLTMVWKLMGIASKSWRALNGSAIIPEVIAGVKFVDGEKQQAA